LLALVEPIQNVLFVPVPNAVVVPLMSCAIPHTSQSPAVSVMDAMAVYEPLAAAVTPVPTLEAYSPTYPVAALSFVFVPSS
jgi:hypothetical protein